MVILIRLIILLLLVMGTLSLFQNSQKALLIINQKLKHLEMSSEPNGITLLLNEVLILLQMTLLMMLAQKRYGMLSLQGLCLLMMPLLFIQKPVCPQKPLKMSLKVFPVSIQGRLILWNVLILQLSKSFQTIICLLILHSIQVCLLILHLMPLIPA